MHPGCQFGGERNDRQPDLILGETMRRQVRQAGVLRGADSVFATGPATMPQFQGLQAPDDCVGHERGQAQAVSVGEPQLSARMRVHDEPYSGTPARQVNEPGQFHDPIAVPSASIRIERWDPHVGGNVVDCFSHRIGQGEPDRIRQLSGCQVFENA